MLDIHSNDQISVKVIKYCSDRLPSNPWLNFYLKFLFKCAPCQLTGLFESVCYNIMFSSVIWQ